MRCNQQYRRSSRKFDCIRYVIIVRKSAYGSTSKICSLVKPQIVRIVPDSLNVTVYTNVSSVKCIAVGFPRPDVYWYRRDKNLSTFASPSPVDTVSRTTNERNLTLGKVDWLQNGKYFCHANSTIDNKKFSDTKSVSLTLRSKLMSTRFTNALLEMCAEQVTFDSTHSSQPTMVGQAIHSSYHVRS